MTIKRIWAWIKVLVDKVFRKSEPEPTPCIPTEFDKKLGRKIQQRRAKVGRPVDTRQGGPNMPQYQSCPLCNRMAKRKRKTMNGAHYWCGKCKSGFFVRAK